MSISTFAFRAGTDEDVLQITVFQKIILALIGVLHGDNLVRSRQSRLIRHGGGPPSSRALACQPDATSNQFMRPCLLRDG
jgi:hypothetical protein